MEITIHKTIWNAQCIASHTIHSPAIVHHNETINAFRKLGTDPAVTPKENGNLDWYQIWWESSQELMTVKY